MTLEELLQKYRPRLLGYFAECYAARKLAPSEVGMELDRLFSGTNALLSAIVTDARKGYEEQKEPPKINGHMPVKETKAPVGRTA